MTEIRKKFPIGIQCFETIRNENFAYVDKTALIYKLVDEGKYYFLSRPRRFGKSLLVSTLESYFSGKKELFEGLAMEKLEREWKCFPVIRLDLNGNIYAEANDLICHLENLLLECERKFAVETDAEGVAGRFAQLIKRVCQKFDCPVVVLVDEYDKPVLDAIGNDSLVETYRNQLKGFYGVLKPSSPYLKFVLLTGVTKFSQVSVFSDLNQLQDISMLSEYDALCGITEEELLANFKGDIQKLAESNGLTFAVALSKLRRRYDGYHFSNKMLGVFNPFSVLNVLQSNEFSDFWFQTGTPTYLVELLRRSRYDITNLEEIHLQPVEFANYRADIEMPIPMIYQSGYLTIQGYDSEYDDYTLGYPNEEVRTGFIRFMAPLYVPPVLKPEFSVVNFTRALNENRVEDFMNSLKAFIAGMDYELFVNNLSEKYFQTIFYLIFRLVGTIVNVEVHSSNGRMDAVVMTKNLIYIFEFKLDKTAAVALQQIETKNYAGQLQLDGRQVVKVGANFSSRSHGLESWIIQ